VTSVFEIRINLRILRIFLKIVL